MVRIETFNTQFTNLIDFRELENSIVESPSTAATFRNPYIHTYIHMYICMFFVSSEYVQYVDQRVSEVGFVSYMVSEIVLQGQVFALHT